ncbi:Putative Bro-N domain-containing protein [Pediococcus acidilactici]|nr:Putative Bro-N domain-containing protein [Pediococcus acidilactici]ARW26647.1 Putative Bro-N domain-containing protein [Pediococcus acidilactici]ARW28723.1 Putative Bro-N domain-containing protein [Pediococcus acidilactici]OBR30920.1 putative Bro-N domain-containing protein [Pediococcus acidilactici]
MTVISEPGIYQLAGQSKLPTAEPFQDWVYEEVIPSIRKHGAYLTDKKAYDVTHDKDALADLLVQAGNQLKEKDLVIEEMKPKALFADSVAASHTTILIGEMAKVLRGNGVDIGANRLFQWLRKNGYLINRKGTDWNMPSQKAMDLGLFKIKETSISHADGSVSISKTTKVTGKGQQYFISKFLKKRLV